MLRQHANCRLCTYVKEGYKSCVKATRKLKACTYAKEGYKSRVKATRKL
jgi:hypothetical protein